MIRVGLRLDEAARKANLKIARLVGSNINRDWDSKRMIKGLENLVHHVAWRDFVFVGPVKWLFNLMKRCRDVDPAKFLNWRKEGAVGFLGLDVVLFQDSSRVGQKISQVIRLSSCGRDADGESGEIFCLRFIEVECQQRHRIALVSANAHTGF